MPSDLFLGDLSDFRPDAPPAPAPNGHLTSDQAASAPSPIGTAIIRGLRGIKDETLGMVGPTARAMLQAAEQAHGDPSQFLGDMAASALSPLKNLGSVPADVRKGDWRQAAGDVSESIPIVSPLSDRAEQAYVADRKSGDSDSAASADAIGHVLGGAAALAAPDALGWLIKRAAMGATSRMIGPAATPELAETALENQALPGIVRSGSERAQARINPAAADAQTTLTGPAGQKTIGMANGGGPAMRAAMNANSVPGAVEQAISRQLTPDAAESAADAAKAEIIAQMRERPTAQDAFQFARNAQINALGKRGAGPTMTRAGATDVLGSVARAAPASAAAIAKLNALQPLLEAYQNSRGEMLPNSAAPTMRGRIILRTLNRAAGPLTQGAYNLTRPDLLRAAQMAQLGASANQKDSGP